jgi:hypothetical protein
MGIFSSLFGCKKPSNTAASTPEPSGYQFEQPENTACFSCRHVIKGSAAILYVTHDADDGGWQFLCGGDHTEDDAMIVGMGEVVKMDPSLNELHEMPEGVGATREKRGGTWTMFRKQ